MRVGQYDCCLPFAWNMSPANLQLFVVVPFPVYLRPMIMEVEQIVVRHKQTFQCHINILSALKSDYNTWHSARTRSTDRMADFDIVRCDPTQISTNSLYGRLIEFAGMQERIQSRNFCTTHTHIRGILHFCSTQMPCIYASICASVVWREYQLAHYGLTAKTIHLCRQIFCFVRCAHFEHNKPQKAGIKRAVWLGRCLS